MWILCSSMGVDGDQYFFYIQLLELNQQSKIRFKCIPCKREKIKFKIDVQKLDLIEVQTPREEIAWTKIIYKVYDTRFQKYLYYC
jgi:hypothetical protein